MDKTFYTIVELTKRYGNISKRTIKRWEEFDNFPKPCFVKRGLNTLYHVDEVHAWEKNSMRPSSQVA